MNKQGWGQKGNELEFAKAYHMEKVTSWLDRGGDINVTSFSKQGHTLLMMSCINGHDKLCAELCRRGADVNLKTNGKVRPLRHISTRCRGAYPYTARLSCPQTALMLAAVFGRPQCALDIVNAGADVHLRSDVDDSEYTEYDGMTALEMIEHEIEVEGMKPNNLRVLQLLRERTAKAPAPKPPR